MPETSPSNVEALVQIDPAAARSRELRDSLDVRGPARPRSPAFDQPNRPAGSTPLPSPGAERPRTILSARVDPPTTELVSRALALGITAAQAQATPTPVLRELIAAHQRVTVIMASMPVQVASPYLTVPEAAASLRTTAHGIIRS